MSLDASGVAGNNWRMTLQTPLGDPIGRLLTDWVPPARPLRVDVCGDWAALEAMTLYEHAEPLFEAFADDPQGRIWTYMFGGPFDDSEAFQTWIEDGCLGEDPLFFALRDLRSGLLGGMASFMRITPDAGTIEIGNIAFAPRFQRSAAATEAIFLMIDRAFALGYRRVEWKCNALNMPSRRAARRLGFTYEGAFRQHMVVKGRNRDTAWYAIIDADWPRLRPAYEAWLSPSNFDAQGRQRRSLSDLTAPLIAPTSVPGA